MSSVSESANSERIGAASSGSIAEDIQLSRVYVGAEWLTRRTAHLGVELLHTRVLGHLGFQEAGLSISSVAIYVAFTKLYQPLTWIMAMGTPRSFRS